MVWCNKASNSLPFNERRLSYDNTDAFRQECGWIWRGIYPYPLQRFPVNYWLALCYATFKNRLSPASGGLRVIKQQWLLLLILLSPASGGLRVVFKLGCKGSGFFLSSWQSTWICQWHRCSCNPAICQKESLVTQDSLFLRL